MMTAINNFNTPSTPSSDHVIPMTEEQKEIHAKIEKYVFDETALKASFLGEKVLKKFELFQEKTRLFFIAKIIIQISQISILAASFVAEKATELYEFLQTGSFLVKALIGFVIPPVAIALICISIFQTIMELYHSYHTIDSAENHFSSLFSSEKISEQKLKEQLTFLKANYFAISHVEKHQIIMTVESVYQKQLIECPEIFFKLADTIKTTEEYKQKLASNAEKQLLNLKLKTLGRRVSLSFAKKMQDKLPALLDQIGSSDRLEQIKGIAAAKVFFSQATAHVRTQILVHIVALVTLVTSIISLFIIATTSSGGLFHLACSAISCIGTVFGILLWSDWIYSKISTLFATNVLRTSPSSLTYV